MEFRYPALNGNLTQNTLVKSHLMYIIESRSFYIISCQWPKSKSQDAV